MPPGVPSLRAEARRRGVSVYQVRKERGLAEGITGRTAVGHGPIPIRTARNVERQIRGGRNIPVKTLEKHRPGIVEYEKRQHGAILTGKRHRAFTRLENLERWIEENQMTDVVTEYGEIKKVGDRWVLVLQR